MGKTRWVVERTFAWLHQFKRLRIRYEVRADLHLGLLQFACGITCLRNLRWQYTHGVAEPELVDPDTWATDHREISRPGLDRIQLDLFRDYATNPPLYPRLHEYFRTRQVPLLAIWGAKDEIFGPDGARAFAKDLENAQIQLIPDGGHFLLESHLDTVADAMRTFLGQHLSPRA